MARFSLVNEIEQVEQALAQLKEHVQARGDLGFYPTPEESFLRVPGRLLVHAAAAISGAEELLHSPPDIERASQYESHIHPFAFMKRRG